MIKPSSGVERGPFFFSFSFETKKKLLELYYPVSYVVVYGTGAATSFFLFSSLLWCRICGGYFITSPLYSARFGVLVCYNMIIIIIIIIIESDVNFLSIVYHCAIHNLPIFI